MNLRDLQYLVAVAEKLNFGQAAEQCFISQPTLSMQIKKLEETLGVLLFERSNKKVLPTPVGEQIVAAARRILLETDVIKQLAATAQSPLAGNLRLGGFPTLAPYLFPQLVGLISVALPDIRLILVEEKTEELIGQLTSGALDAALLALPVAEEGLLTLALFEDEFLLAVHSRNPLAVKQSVSQSDLRAQQFLLLDEGHCLRGQALQVCDINGAAEHQDLRATSLETLRQMVRAGTGMTFMPRIAVRSSEDNICYIPFSEPVPKRSIALAWRKTSPRGLLMVELANLVSQAAKR